MAETEEAAAGGADDAAAAPAPKSKRKLFMIAGAALLLIGGGAGSYFMFFKSKSAEHHVEAPKPPVFMDVPEIMVNLAGAGPGERVQYLKLKIVLEVKDQPLVAAIQPTMPRVLDIFQTYLRELRASDLNGSGGIYRLKEELGRRVNAAISPGEINAVLFKEIVIQ